MCGILGSVGRELSRDVLEILHHRGPDSHGLESVPMDGEVAYLGHTRLAILDLSPAGHQPLQSRDGRWWVTFNGEIYNHLDLRKRLAGLFRGHSDTETLVELLAAKGIEETLRLLNGMFAFAALDTREQKLYLVRDPFGIKPLYYAGEGDRFAFASEARVLHTLGYGGDVSSQGLRRFLSLRYVPSPITLWKGVERLPPGHWLTLDMRSGARTLENYTRPVADHFSGTLEDAVAAYQEQLGKAVARQMLSDVPVGILLSGGVDSALIAAMAKDCGAEPPCFSVGFGGGHLECEIEDARETARVLDLPFSAVTVTPDQLRDALPEIVRAVEEPLGTTSIMPMWYLVKRARQDVTVVLTGQGTDEPWGGYRRYQVEMVRRLLPFDAFWKVLAGMGSGWSSMPEVIERGLRTLPLAHVADRAMEACALFPPEERKRLLGVEDDGEAAEAMVNWFRWLAEWDGPPAERMMRVDARMNLADDLLLYGDKISMAASLEARVPMLDLELVHFVESLPLEYRLGFRKAKIAHKLMAEAYLPSAIVHRRKKGFQVPFSEWSRGIWRDFVTATLLDVNAPHFAVLERDVVAQVWNEHLEGRPGRARQVFALLMLALWWKEQSNSRV